VGGFWSVVVDRTPQENGLRCCVTMVEALYGLERQARINPF
jgi:hypothetical protein